MAKEYRRPADPEDMKLCEPTLQKGRRHWNAGGEDIRHKLKRELPPRKGIQGLDYAGSQMLSKGLCYWIGLSLEPHGSVVTYEKRAHVHAGGELNIYSNVYAQS